MQPSSPVVLNGAELTVPDVESVARGRRYAVLEDDARERVAQARAVIERLVASGEVVYGVTTGVGSLASTFVPPERARELQERLLLSHAAGVGTPLPTEVVRAMLLLRANTLALGHSGCRPDLIERLLLLLRLRIHPVVPAQGRVGASGDLAPLAHLALPIIGAVKAMDGIYYRYPVVGSTLD
jgi:histidine ammonia-lyase